MITPSSNLCMPLFSLPSQKGKKTDRGLYREQKQKYLTDTRRNCHPCGFHLVKTNKKRTGTAKKLSLSLPPPHFPLFSLSPSPSLSLSLSLCLPLSLFLSVPRAWNRPSCLKPTDYIYLFTGVFTEVEGILVLACRILRFRVEVISVFSVRAEDAWFFLNSRLLLFSIFRSP